MLLHLLTDTIKQYALVKCGRDKRFEGRDHGDE
jgi:hypothetical protein